MNDTVPLIDRGKSMLDQLLRMAQTRLEMLSIEIQREKLELARTIRLAAALAVCAWLCGFTLVLLAALALPAHLRLPMLAALCGVLLIATFAFWYALRRRAGRTRLFKRLIDQLELDRDALKRDS